MIFIVCDQCSVGLRISPGEKGLECEQLLGPMCEWWPNKYPCFVCGGPSQVTDVSFIDFTKVVVHDVTPKEAFAAMNGLGLPKERECSAEAVRALLTGRVIKRIEVRQIRGSHRCAIDHLELDDGTKVYFGAAPVGAIIYRVAPKHSYAEAVDHE